MKKDIDTKDTISEGTLHEILLDIKYRLDHLEDIEADNRELLVKVIKQGNQIVEFLKGCDVQLEDDFDDIPFSGEEKDVNNYKKLSELFYEFMQKNKDLKEFEKELKKYKKDITPGIVGES